MTPEKPSLLNASRHEKLRPEGAKFSSIDEIRVALDELIQTNMLDEAISGLSLEVAIRARMNLGHIAQDLPEEHKKALAAALEKYVRAQTDRTV